MCKESKGLKYTDLMCMGMAEPIAESSFKKGCGLIKKQEARIPSPHDILGSRSQVIGTFPEKSYSK